MDDKVYLCRSGEDWFVCCTGKSQIAMGDVQSSIITWIFPSPSRGVILWSASCFPSDFLSCFFLHHEMDTIVQSSSALFSLPRWRYCLFPLKTFFLSLFFLTLVIFLQILKCQPFLDHLSRSSPYDLFTLVTDQLSLAFLANNMNHVWKHNSK